MHVDVHFFYFQKGLILPFSQKCGGSTCPQCNSVPTPLEVSLRCILVAVPELTKNTSCIFRLYPIYCVFEVKKYLSVKWIQNVKIIRCYKFVWNILSLSKKLHYTLSFYSLPNFSFSTISVGLRQCWERHQLQLKGFFITPEEKASECINFSPITNTIQPKPPSHEKVKFKNPRLHFQRYSSLTAPCSHLPQEPSSFDPIAWKAKVAKRWWVYGNTLQNIFLRDWDI